MTTQQTTQRTELQKKAEQIAELDRIAKMLVRRDLELLQLNDELRKIDEAKSHFVTIAAHQLRTPLSIVKWTFEMLLSGDFGPLNKDQDRVLKQGRDVNDNMIKLVSDLLDVARFEIGRFVHNFADISINDIIEEVIGINAIQAKERRLTLEVVDKMNGKAPIINGDKRNLIVVLDNLVNNALNYTLPEGKITVTYEQADGFVEVRVDDSGVGVPEHQMSRLFTKFFRGDNVVRMQTQGSGLGLFIAASIIKAHGGTYGARSKEEGGSTFWFRLPIKLKTNTNH